MLKDSRYARNTERGNNALLYLSYSSFKHSCNVRSNNKTINSDFTFQTAYHSWKNKIDELGFYSGFAYDAIVAMALALNSSAQILAKRNKSLDEFTYKDAEMAQIFKDSLSNVKFLGFSVKPFVCFPLNRVSMKLGLWPVFAVAQLLLSA